MFDHWLRRITRSRRIFLVRHFRERACCKMPARHNPHGYSAFGKRDWAQSKFTEQQHIKAAYTNPLEF